MSDPATLRVLVATDLHLGFGENDPIREDDTFRAFEEVLLLARDCPRGTGQRVDFVLLAGDLFHENKPSRRTLHRCMELLRAHTMGADPVSFEIVSDPATTFAGADRVNFLDENLNVGVPVFAIHGNHDDPAGAAPALSALDILSVSGLINYFGKQDNPDDITIYPILFQKGDTRLALYGLGAIRDERLYQTFQKKKVKLMKPTEFEDSWFNVLTLHQNRVAHNPTAYVHEEMLDDFLHLVVWGHEHESKVEPEQNEGQFYVTQPGSTVATSLSESEASQKNAALLEIRGFEPPESPKFRVTAQALSSVRHFIWVDLEVTRQTLLDQANVDAEDPNYDNVVSNFLAAEIDRKLKKYAQRLRGQAFDERAALEPNELPLVRLRVQHDGLPPIHSARFGQRFVGRVANPADVLLWSKAKKRSVRAEKGSLAARAEELNFGMSESDTVSLEATIEREMRGKDLEALDQEALHEALKQFVDKDEKTAFKIALEKELDSVQKALARKLAQDATGPVARKVTHTHLSELMSELMVSRAEGDSRSRGASRRVPKREEMSDDEGADDPMRGAPDDDELLATNVNSRSAAKAANSSRSVKRRTAVKSEPGTDSAAASAVPQRGRKVKEEPMSQARRQPARKRPVGDSEAAEPATVAFDMGDAGDDEPPPAARRQQSKRRKTDEAAKYVNLIDSSDESDDDDDYAEESVPASRSARRR